MGVKSLQEINLEFIEKNLMHGRNPVNIPGSSALTKADPPIFQAKKKKRRGLTIISAVSNTLFYSAMTLIFFVILTFGAENGSANNFFGYSCFTVISRSIQDEIPVGSFIIVKSTDPQYLKTGDNITYMVDRTTSVTHKIVEIHEDHYIGGKRGFITMGVNNAHPDDYIVSEANIVGKVIFAVPVMGAFLSHLAANVYIVFVIFGLCVIISFCLQGLFDKKIKAKRRILNECGSN